MSHTAALLIQLGCLLFVMSLLSRFASYLKQSAISFYMTFGLFLGAGSALPLTESREFLKIGAELGVILLLLMIGLEYSPKELIGSIRKSRAIAAYDALLNAIPGALAGWLLGWGWLGAMMMAGVTWISSSGVVVRVLADLKRMSNRETPTIIRVLVLEDLAMAFYLPILSAVAVGGTLLSGAIAVGVALGLVIAIVLVAYRFGTRLSRVFAADQPESLLLGVIGLATVVAGISAEVQVSTAVGAFLVGIALSGRVAASAEKVLVPTRDLFAAMFFVYFGIQTNPGDIPAVFVPALVLAILTMATKVWTGFIAAKADGIALMGRWRAGLVLTARGEFSIVIASLAVASGVDAQIMPFAATYMLITVIAGPVLSRFAESELFKKLVLPKPHSLS